MDDIQEGSTISIDPEAKGTPRFDQFQWSEAALQLREKILNEEIEGYKAFLEKKMGKPQSKEESSIEDSLTYSQEATKRVGKAKK